MLQGTTPAAEPKMLTETAKRLHALLYSSNRCTDGDRLVRFMRATLARPDIGHRDVNGFSEAEALRLIDAFERTFPDHDADIASKVVRTVSSRP